MYWFITALKVRLGPHCPFLHVTSINNNRIWNSLDLNNEKYYLKFTKNKLNDSLKFAVYSRHTFSRSQHNIQPSPSPIQPPKPHPPRTSLKCYILTQNYLIENSLRCFEQNLLIYYSTKGEIVHLTCTPNSDIQSQVSPVKTKYYHGSGHFHREKFQIKPKDCFGNWKKVIKSLLSA